MLKFISVDVRLGKSSMFFIQMKKITFFICLGQIIEIRSKLTILYFFQELCGHVLQIDCGHGSLEIIVTNSNYGGGLDLYSETTWPQATNNQPPGEARCSVVLTGRNPISGKKINFIKLGSILYKTFIRLCPCLFQISK